MRVVAAGALVEPLEDVEALGAVELDGVAVEEVGNERGVALGGKVVGHELAVLPDADDVGDVEQAVALLGLVDGRRGEVGVDAVGDLDILAGGLAPGGVSQDEMRGWRLRAGRTRGGFRRCSSGRGGWRPW